MNQNRLDLQPPAVRPLRSGSVPTASQPVSTPSSYPRAALLNRAHRSNKNYACYRQIPQILVHSPAGPGIVLCHPAPPHSHSKNTRLPNRLEMKEHNKSLADAAHDARVLIRETMLFFKTRTIKDYMANLDEK